MQPHDSEPHELRGSRRRDRIANAAKQLKHARKQADGWEANALRALEADCYELLTGGFQRASELPEATHQRLLTGGEGDEVDRVLRDGESRDKNGHIRPVPPGVPNRPEGDQ